MHEGPLSPRPLESALFGVPVLAADVTPATTAQDIVAAARGVPGALIVVRMPATALTAAQELEAAGARLTDVLLTLERSVPSEPDPVGVRAFRNADAIGIRPAVSADTTALAGVAERCFDAFVGHWHADARLSPGLAQQLYVQWTRELVTRRSERTPLFVAVGSDDTAVAFLAFAPDRDGWHVPLTAVDPAWRGQGLLVRLLATALDHVAAPNAGRVAYETQITNVAALRAVTRLGFLPATSRLTFHLWTAAQ